MSVTVRGLTGAAVLALALASVIIYPSSHLVADQRHTVAEIVEPTEPQANPEALAAGAATNEPQPVVITPQPVIITAKSFDPDYQPDLDSMEIAVLKDGPRVKKGTKYTVIRNRHTSEVHHAWLVIETFNKRLVKEVRRLTQCCRRTIRAAGTT